MTVHVNGKATVQVYEYQAPAVLNQATPVQNTWYVILAAADNVRVYGIAVNIEDVNETIEVQITVDGETIAAVGFAASHSTTYYAKMVEDAINRTDLIDLTSGVTVRSDRAFLIEGHNVKVEARKTTATGTGNLTGIVTHGVLKNAR